MAADGKVAAGGQPFTEGGVARGNLVGHYQPNFAHVIGFNLGKRF